MVAKVPVHQVPPLVWQLPVDPSKREKHKVMQSHIDVVIETIFVQYNIMAIENNGNHATYIRIHQWHLNLVLVHTRINVIFVFPCP